ncbi:MAG: hypothetical protein IJ165_08275 [Proteobacteria bacterium]|nr:hypothetical protein [Pseudomonadota bacterium]
MTALIGALGNLLPLAQNTNSSHQNDSFDDKRVEPVGENEATRMVPIPKSRLPEKMYGMDSASINAVCICSTSCRIAGKSI